MPEVGNLPLPQKILASGVTDMLRVSDARMSGTSYGTVVLHVSPEAAVGGPLAAVRTGDVVILDVANRTLDIDVDADEIASRTSRLGSTAGGRLTALKTAAEHRSSSATLHLLACDAAQLMFPATLDESLQKRKLRLTSAIVYGPATSPTVVAALLAAVDGPVVELIVSDAAEPRDSGREWLVTDLPRLLNGQESCRRRLVLGWRHRNGVPAWHNAEEISAAAIAALALPPGDRVLGVVRPWRDRPE